MDFQNEDVKELHRLCYEVLLFVQGSTKLDGSISVKFNVYKKMNTIFNKMNNRIKRQNLIIKQGWACRHLADSCKVELTFKRNRVNSIMLKQDGGVAA